MISPKATMEPLSDVDILRAELVSCVDRDKGDEDCDLQDEVEIIEAATEVERDTDADSVESLDLNFDRHDSDAVGPQGSPPSLAGAKVGSHLLGTRGRLAENDPNVFNRCVMLKTATARSCRRSLNFLSTGNLAGGLGATGNLASFGGGLGATMRRP
eukprot:TRINITY_DN11597_c0_g1_i6.p2 TRINITY_DN11597_c0_g1~~TRINITY_DN11597_c0_g1_i6.p2  ORF type:complete len:157 (-),score=30.12 TRINITY_DN11597_c0_g1_i6:179-649(-)